MIDREKVDDAFLVLCHKASIANLTDRQLKLVIKALKEVLLHRQQERATKRYKNKEK